MSSVGTGARDQVARLMALIPYLQNRTDVPLDQVAADFGVTEARIRKDLEVLWFCGLPGLGMGDLIEIDMESVDGAGVIHLTNAEYLSRPLRLNRVEASALLVALRTLREGAHDEERALVDQVLAKIEAAAGETAPVDVRLPESAAHISGLRDVLEKAIADGVRVQLTYYVPSRDEETERVVDPLAVSTAGGHTYLDAWCHQAQDQRLFRLDRITSTTRLEQPADVHADVTPRDLTEAIFQPADEDTLVTLELQPSARWVTEYYPVESVQSGPGERLTVQLRAGDQLWLTRLVLRLGGQAQVVSPPEVRAAVTAAAQATLSHYL